MRDTLCILLMSLTHPICSSSVHVVISLFLGEIMSNTTKVNHSHKIVLQAQSFSFCKAGQVLLAIAYHAKKPEKSGEGWRCFPSRQKIAELTGMVERTVFTQTERLIKAGLIKIIKNGKKGIANVYELNLDLLFNPTAHVFFTLTNKEETSESQAIVRMSKERSENGLKKHLAKIGIIKNNQKTYPQPTQNPIQPKTGYTGTTSDQNDPSNSTRLKDLKENNAQGATPSPFMNFSKRAIEMIAESIKCQLSKANDTINRLSTGSGTESELTQAFNDLNRINADIERYTPVAQHYGIAI